MFLEQHHGSDQKGNLSTFQRKSVPSDRHCPSLRNSGGDGGVSGTLRRRRPLGSARFHVERNHRAQRKNLPPLHISGRLSFRQESTVKKNTTQGKPECCAHSGFPFHKNSVRFFIKLLRNTSLFDFREIFKIDSAFAGNDQQNHDHSNGNKGFCQAALNAKTASIDPMAAEHLGSK